MERDQCGRCGETMRAETVIKLRRGWFGIRATRWEGAYCTDCKRSVTPGGAAEAPAAPRGARPGAGVRLRSPTCVPA